MFCQVLVLMPIAAVAVSGAGWIGRAMVAHGSLDAVQPDNAKDIFMTVAGTLCPSGVRGFVMAAVLAALMSTLEALINAVSAVAVNDIWRPILRPGQSDAHYLRVARYVAVAANALGIALIPVFAKFASIYQALTTFTGIVTPPLVVVICLGAIWKRFTPAAAFWTLVFGWGAIVVSLFFPELITPLAHGEPPTAGHGYMRSLFGLVVSGVLGVAITPFTRPRAEQEIPGLVLSTIAAGRRLFKGGEPNERDGASSVLLSLVLDEVEPAQVRLPHRMMVDLQADPGDLLYVSDSRWWLGGLRSVHVKAGPPHDQPDGLLINAATAERGNLKINRPVRVERLM
jgi:SSS family solute:Na+ symporter